MAKREKEVWFKAKQYGWGWGLPANRKGWLAFGIFIAVWASALAWLVSTTSPEDEIAPENLTLFAVIIIADILGMLYVSFKYGEAPKWRWGGKERAAKSDKS